MTVVAPDASAAARPEMPAPRESDALGLREPSSPLDYRAVLVPLDGSPRAERALGPAGWLAQRLDAELHVIVVDVHRPETWWHRRYLESLVDHQPGITPHRSSDPGVAHAVRSVADELAPTVVCAATHGQSGSAAFVGSAFAAIIGASAGSSIAVGARTRAAVDEAAGRIVACVDGTRVSEVVLPSAVAWAHRLGMRLSVATVAEPTLPPIVTGAHRHRAYGPDTDPDDYVRRLVTRPELASLDVDGTVIWDPISPHTGILDHLEQHPATLLAVTSHVRIGIARTLLHSEATRIIEASPVPVLVHPVPRGTAANQRSC